MAFQYSSQITESVTKETEVVTDELARVMSWSGPVLPAVKDPSPFVGTPALR